MKNYMTLGFKILKKNNLVVSRNGDIYALYGETLKFDLQKGFPLLTNKFINFNHIIHETLWYLKGTDKITYLKENNINIWNLWADENESIGPTYGVQWRNFNGIDQLKIAINDLKNNKFSRRIIISGWNVGQLSEMKLPPCLVLIQFNVDNNNNLHSVIYQRSGDFAIGVPYDIAEMALLTHIIANVCDLTPGTLTIQYGNIHIYKEHVDSFVNIQAKNKIHRLPKLKIKNKIDNIDNIKAEDIELKNYNYEKFIRYKIKE